MARTIKSSEERRQTLESWADLYGAQVLRLAFLYCGDETIAQEVFIRTFVLIARRFDALQVIPDDMHKVFATALEACHVPVQQTVPPVVEDGGILQLPAEGVELENVSLHPWVDAVSALPRAEKDVLCSFALTGADVAALSRVLLLPQKLINARLQRALSELVTGMQGITTDLDLDTLRITLQDVLASVVIPEWLRTRTSQQIRATFAQLAADKRHRGPTWLMYATIATCVFSCAAIGYGLEKGHATTAVVTNTNHLETAPGLPSPLQNLPGSVLAQFQLPAAFSLHNLDHVAIGKNALYWASLQQRSDAWPTIVLQASDFGDSGKSLIDVEKNVAAVKIIPPMAPQPPQSKPTPPDWTIQDWRMDISDPWAVVQVHWGQRADKNSTVTQIYSVYIPTGKSSLVKTIGTQKLPTGSVVTAGDGKVIIQSSIRGKASEDTNTLIGLPLDVYTLTGTDSLRALGGPNQIAAPFGLMVRPNITGGTLVFQGIAGQPDDATATNATWYTLSWDGQLSRYAGPPLDGRPHWALRGVSGKLWWCETTPDGANANNIQVLMAPLEDESGAQQVAAQTLSGSVQYFTVSGESMAWVQTTKNVTQLVVESAE